MAREQRSQLDNSRQRVAWLGQREQAAVQGAQRARQAAALSLSILLRQARALDSALSVMKANPPTPCLRVLRDEAMLPYLTFLSHCMTWLLQRLLQRPSHDGGPDGLW